MVTTGCVSLAPAVVPSSHLDVQANNGWVRDLDESTEVEGGWFSKQAVKTYEDMANDERGFPGFLQIVSLRGMLSPDREELQERVRERLQQNAREKGLTLDQQVTEGQRRLANDALSFYVVFNATSEDDSGFFPANAKLKIIGEVFRCTGGATVIASGSAQVESARQYGPIEDRDYEPRTWAEIVRDPSGTIEGFSGSNGLIYNIQCGG